MAPHAGCVIHARDCIVVLGTHCYAASHLSTRECLFFCFFNASSLFPIYFIGLRQARPDHKRKEISIRTLCKYSVVKAPLHKGQSSFQTQAKRPVSQPAPFALLLSPP